MTFETYSEILRIHLRTKEIFRRKGEIGSQLGWSADIGQCAELNQEKDRLSEESIELDHQLVEILKKEWARVT